MRPRETVQQYRVRLDAVRSVRQQDRRIQRGKRALRFRREIDVTGRVDQRIAPPAIKEIRLIGKHGNAALTLDLIGIQHGASAIDAPERAHCAGFI